MESLQNILQTIREMQRADFLDIALVAFLIYNLLPLIRTPNTLRVVKAVGVLIVVSWFTNVMKLHTLNWIFNQILAIGLLAFVILFQPELRKMLDHIGSVRFMKFFGNYESEKEMDGLITQTVQACDIMSREKVGALIVFAREQRLDEHFKTGTQIDGILTEQLLRNIFFPKAALHDGAVIVRDGRVAAAGCVLPLSQNAEISADLGTRHRAGLGMSEATDAVVVIVSEETGIISVATGGMLKRQLTKETLEKLLYQELKVQEPEEQTNVKKFIGKKR